MAEQRLDDPNIGPLLQKVRGEAVPQCMHADLLGDASGLARRPARRMQNGDVDCTVFIAARKQKALRTGKLPIGAQNAEQVAPIA